MQTDTSATVVATTARVNNITLFASLELGKSKWLVTVNSPGSEKFSKHVVEGGDSVRPLDLLSRAKAKAEQRFGLPVGAIVIQEAGLEGFWIHRLLVANGIVSHVVDAASIAVDRRHRRVKTDAIDGDTLLPGLAASDGSVQWFACRARKKKIAGACRGNAVRCSRSAFSIPIG